MRRLSLVVCLCVLTAAIGAPRVTAGQIRRSVEPQSPLPVESVAGDRLGRLERWLKAAARHAPGGRTTALAEVAAWPNANLRELWIDANVLIQIMRGQSGDRFSVRADGQAKATQIRYTTDAAPSAARAGVCGGRRSRRDRVQGGARGGRARSGAPATGGARPRSGQSWRRQLHPAARRPAAQRHRDARAAGDGRTGRVAIVDRTSAVPDGDLRRPPDRSPPVGRALGNRAHAARLRQAARQRSRGAGARRDGPPVVPRDGGVDAAARRPRQAAPRSGARALPGGSGHPLSERLPARNVRGSADPDRGAIGRAADRRDARRRIRSQRAARGGGDVPPRPRGQAGSR